jgi:hypothetical protein
MYREDWERYYRDEVGRLWGLVEEPLKSKIDLSSFIDWVYRYSHHQQWHGGWGPAGQELLEECEEKKDSESPSRALSDELRSLSETVYVQLYTHCEKYANELLANHTGALDSFQHLL